MELDSSWYLILFIASIIGGLVGSLSGGAGMVTMPLLLLSGISPLQALATNKLQACVGSLTSATRYYQSGLVDLKQSRALIAISVVFASLGALSVQFVSLDFLAKALPFVMIGLGTYFLLSPNINNEDRAHSSEPHLYGSCALASVYGGFMGVGIGSFILAILVAVAGYGLSKALAHSRWIVFSINLSSTAFFLLGGQILWILGTIMCIGQMIGASLGTKLAIKHGSKIIRPAVIVLCFAISTQLLINEFF